MSKIAILFCGILLIAFSSNAQITGTYQIKGADTVKFWKSGGTINPNATEFILQNNTDTVPGFLFNIGNGVTHFKRALTKINSTTYLVGVDTLYTGTGGGGSPGGNNNQIQINENSTFVGLPTLYFDTTKKTIVIGGASNTINGGTLYNFVNGTNNLITSNYGAAFGFGNITGSYGYAFGSGNGVAGYSISVGATNTNTNLYSATFGNNLINTYPNSLVIGQFNDTTAWPNAANSLTPNVVPIFSIGNGAGNTSRNNVFSILRNGQVILNLFNNSTLDSSLVVDQNGNVKQKKFTSGGGGSGGTLDSVGLVMPVGFTVINTPLTGTGGTIHVTTSMSGVVVVSGGVFTGAQIVDSNVANVSWSKIMSTPTTVTGYGITNAVRTDQTYSNPTFISSLAWSKITGTPTTIAGYGITDSIVYNNRTYANPTWITQLAWSKITGTPTTIAGYGIVDNIVNSINGFSGTVVQKSADSITHLPVDTTNHRNGYVVTFDSTNHKFYLSGVGSGGSAAFSGLTDVSVISPANNQIPVYVTGTGKWTNTSVTTTIIPEGTNLYWTNARFLTAFKTENTDSLPQGSSNLYFTNTLARNAISGSPPLNYVSSTGVMSLNYGRGLTVGSGNLIADTGVMASINYVTTHATAGTVTSITPGLYMTPSGAITVSGGFGADTSASGFSGYYIRRKDSTSYTTTYQNSLKTNNLASGGAFLGSGVYSGRPGSPTGIGFYYVTDSARWSYYNSSWTWITDPVGETFTLNLHNSGATGNSLLGGSSNTILTPKLRDSATTGIHYTVAADSALVAYIGYGRGLTINSGNLISDTTIMATQYYVSTHGGSGAATNISITRNAEFSLINSSTGTGDTLHIGTLTNSGLVDTAMIDELLNPINIRNDRTYTGTDSTLYSNGDTVYAKGFEITTDNNFRLTDNTNQNKISLDIRLRAMGTAGSCTNCNITFDSTGRASSYTNGSGGGGSQTLQQTFNQEVGGSVFTKTDTAVLGAFNWLFSSTGGVIAPLTTNSIDFGTNSLAWKTIHALNWVSPGTASIGSASGAPIDFNVNGTQKASILSTGQRMDSAYIGNVFPGTVTGGTPDSIVTINNGFYKKVPVSAISGIGGSVTITATTGSASGSTIAFLVSTSTSNSALTTSGSGANLTFNHPTQWNYGNHTTSTSAFWGSNAGPATAPGVKNVGFGPNVMAALNSYANWNTAVGSESMQNADSAYQDTYFGALAGTLAWRSHYDVGIGDGALSNDSFGLNQAAVGHAALDFMKRGHDNSAFGSVVLQVDSLGVGNTIGGSHSGAQSFGTTQATSNNFNSWWGYNINGSNHATNQYMIAMGTDIMNVFTQPCDSCIVLGNHGGPAGNYGPANVTAIGNGILWPNRPNVAYIGGMGSNGYRQLVNFNVGGLSTSQRTTIGGFAFGDFNLNTDSLRPEFYDGAGWRKLATYDELAGIGGSTPPNVGAGFRLLAPQTPGFKTLFCSGCTWDSTTNANGLTLTVSGGSPALSSVTALTNNTTINNGAFIWETDYNSLAGTNGMFVQSNSTAAAGNAQVLFHVQLSGANTNSNQMTWAAEFENLHSGTGAINGSALFKTSGAPTDFGIVSTAVFNGFGSAAAALTPTDVLDVESPTAGLLLASSSSGVQSQITFKSNNGSSVVTGGHIYQLPTNYGTTSGAFTQGGLLIRAELSAGLALDAQQVNGSIRGYTGSDANERFRVDSLGRLHLDTLTGVSWFNIGGTQTITSPGNHGAEQSNDWFTVTNNAAASSNVKNFSFTTFMGGTQNETHTAVTDSNLFTVTIDSFPTPGTNVTVVGDQGSLHVRTGLTKLSGGLKLKNISSAVPAGSTAFLHGPDSLTYQTPVSWGTYTPTITTVSNCSSPSAGIGHYTRFGNQVSVDIPVTVVTTVGGTQTEFYVSLPISSAISSGVDLTGQGQIQGLYTIGPGITGNTTNHVADVTYTQTASSSAPNIFLHFTYTVD
jgi:hypothetical protein